MPLGLRLCRLLILTAALLAVPIPSARAATWVWPLATPHPVIRGFAPPAHDWLPGHRGVDLAARVGEPVLAAGPGVIAVAGTIGRTAVVAVRHSGGLETTYESVRATVHVGDTVAAGAVIGHVLSSAHCPMTCLHWGLRRGATYLDPLALVGAARVRLLPVPPPSGTWLVPAAGGASIGSSAVVVAWAVRTQRRRRRRLPPGVADLRLARNRRCHADAAVS